MRSCDTYNVISELQKIPLLRCEIVDLTGVPYPQTQPQKFPRSLPHLTILGIKMIGPWAQSIELQNLIYSRIILRQVMKKIVNGHV